MSSTSNVGAFGAGWATGHWDPLAYFRKPQVILRLVAWVFSIVVFGCIASLPNWQNFCPYANSVSTCSLGIAIGVLSFIGLMALLVTDALFDNMSNVQHRKYVVITDVVFSCSFSFLWLLCFSYMTSKWRRSYKDFGHRSTAEAPLAFAFFCLLIYIALAVLAILKLRKGVEDSTPAYNESHITVPPAAAAGYHEHDSQFSPHPFSSTTSKQPAPATEPPAY